MKNIKKISRKYIRCGLAICLAVLIFFATFLVSCNTQKKYLNDGITIVSSFYPIHLFTEVVTHNVDGIKLVDLTPPSIGCIHDYSLLPADIIQLNSTSLFIVNGGGMESFIDKAIKELPDLRIITASRGIDFLTSNGRLNPHVWMSPDFAAKEVQNIANSLSEFDPIHASIYQKNSEQFLVKIDLLKASISEKLKSVTNRNIITFHAAFDYFAHDFSLNIVSLIENDPDNSPSPSMISEIIDLGKKNNVSALFTEAQYPSDIAAIIANEIGAKTFELDPIVSPKLSSVYVDIPQDEYFMRMEKNADILKNALGG